MAPRRDSAVSDQLPRTWCAPDGRPSDDLQPGTQRKQDASSGSARPAAESVVPAAGVSSLSGSDRRPFFTIQIYGNQMLFY